MRGEMSIRTRFPISHFLINCTHTHSGPASMPLRGNMGILDRNWIAAAQAKIVDLVASLPDQMVPVHTAYGEKEVKGIGFNRQDGGGPQDEVIQTLILETEIGETVATLSCYNCHAVVLGPSNLQLSGDFPGAFCRTMERKLGGVSLYLQGCCGDIDPAMNQANWGKGTFDDCDEIGERLALAALESVSSISRVTEASVRGFTTSRSLALKPPPEDLDSLAVAYRKQLEETEDEETRVCSKAMLDWATELQGMAAAGNEIPPLEAIVSSVTIGDVAIVGLPFEVYTQIGLDIKANPWSRHTMVLGYTNGLNGYCATDEARRRGGYGPDGSHRWFPTLPTPLPDGADAVLIEAAKEALAKCR